jgi:hypothetical protein
MASEAKSTEAAESGKTARAGRSVWRPGRETAGWFRARRFKRGFALVLFLAAVVALLILVFPPLYHPNAQLVFLTGLDYHPLRAPPAEYAQEDSDALEKLAPVLYKHGAEPGPILLSEMRSASAMRGLPAALSEATPDGAGVLIVYIDGHGVSDNGTAYLLCRNFDPANPAAGRYRLSDLLRQVADSPAPLKLLILETGRIEADPRMGMLVNEFPRLLEQEVHATGNESLWVLTSNAILERSHVSRALERSVFGYFVTLGLNGAADANGDRAVDVDELYRFVRTNVAAWVRAVTGGRETQTPLLLWGGGTNLPREKLAVLLPAMNTGSGGGLKLPKTSAKFPDVAGGIASPYTNRATQNFVPIAAKSQKKVPGLKQARKAAKTNAKVSRKIKESKSRKATDAKKPETTPAGAKPDGTKAEPSPAPGDKSPSAADAKPIETGGKGANDAGGETPDTGDKEGAAEESTDVSAAGSSATQKTPLPPPTAGELLAQAWQLRDDMETPSGDEPRPLDYAPQTWREYQQWLLAEEQLYRAGAMSDQKEIAAGLTKVLARLAAAPSPPPLDKDQPSDLAVRISGLRPMAPAGVDSAWSLAMAQCFAQQNHTPLSADAIAAARALDRFAIDGTPAEFAGWVKKLDPALDRYSEVRWARQLAKLPGLDWSIVQLSLVTRRLGEQVPVIAPAALPWIEQRLEAADRLRLDAERQLTDAIGSDRQATASRLFRQAADLYHETADDIAVVTAAMQLRHDLLNRAPFYIAWRENAGWESSADAPKDADLMDLCGRLGELDEVLATPDPAKLEQINKLAAESAALADRIEAGLADANIANLTGPTAGPGSGWRIEVLLSTPLLSAESRQRLLSAAADADAKFAASYRPAKPESIFEPAPIVTPLLWQAIVERAELEAALARLAGGRGKGQARLLDPLTIALADLKAARQRLDGNEGRASDEAVWESCRRFGAALEDFYRALPGRLEAIVAKDSDLTDLAGRPARLAALHSADRMLRLTDVRDLAQSVQSNPAGALAGTSLYDLLLWQERRLETALADAPPAEAEYLTNAASSYFAQAGRIPLQPPGSPPATPPLSISGPTSANLATEPEQLIELALRSTAAHPTDVWIVCRFSPELLEVKAAGEVRLYDEQQLATATDRAALPPTFKLHADSAEPLRLRVRAKTGARQGTRLIIKAIAAGAVVVRHEIDIALAAPQTIELTVEGPPGTWAQSESQISLYPFPNRKTNFHLSLVNNGPTDRDVDVDFLALDAKATVIPPPAALSAEDAAGLLKRFGPTRSVAALKKISLPAGGKPVALPFPASEEKKPAESLKPGAKPAAASASATPSASPPAAAKPAADEPPPPPRSVVDHGLLAVITDRESQLKTIKRIDIEPQRPRRYVRPQIGYSLDRETLQIHIVPQDKALLPPEGVRIHAEIVAPLPPGTQAQLDAELKAPDYVANLFCELPADAGKVVTVRLTVDGYPRAFVYHVPLGIQSSDLAEETDLREIRILAPEVEAAYKAPIESIIVDAQVDAPLGAFQNPDDLLEIGIDVDRDRDLRGSEPRVQLAADRQVNIWLDRSGPGGLFSLDTKIGDFHLAVPTPALRNARVSVLGRIFASGKTGWSEPVDILLDGTPPRIERVELLPAAVVIGPDVEVSIWPTDDNLSGVVKVEAGFDTSGHGKFDETIEPFELSRDANGRWFSKLPTKALDPGVLTLLVRATDRAGNVSDYTKVKCRIITKAEADAAAAAPLAKLFGTVFYGNDPAAGVEMTVTSEKGPKIPAATTDASGNFSFTNIPPGKYKLAAKAVIHNKTRKTEQEVTVESTAVTNPKAVRITLK